MSATLSAALLSRRRTVHTKLITLATATLLLTTVACSKDSSTAPKNVDPVGIYNLVQVDKKAVPVQIFNGNWYDADIRQTYPLMINVTGGSILLEDGGGFHLAVDRAWRTDTDAGQGELLVNGTYRIQGSKIYIDTDSGSGDGAFENGNISFNLDVGETGTMKRYTFRRQ